MPVIFICDNQKCCKVGAGHWTTFGWTIPKEWLAAGGEPLQHITCSAACEERWQEQRGLFEGKQEG